jgi:hypothetical protein
MNTAVSNRLTCNLSKHYRHNVAAAVVRATAGAIQSGNPRLHIAMTLDFVRSEFAAEPRYVTLFSVGLMDHCERKGLL